MHARGRTASDRDELVDSLTADGLHALDLGLCLDSPAQLSPNLVCSFNIQRSIERLTIASRGRTKDKVGAVKGDFHSDKAHTIICPWEKEKESPS